MAASVTWSGRWRASEPRSAPRSDRHHADGESGAAEPHAEEARPSRQLQASWRASRLLVDAAIVAALPGNRRTVGEIEVDGLRRIHRMPFLVHAPSALPTSGKRCVRGPLKATGGGRAACSNHPIRFRNGLRQGRPADSAQEAEGEGFEPSIRLTTDNGFRAPVRFACLGVSQTLCDNKRDSRHHGSPTWPVEAAGIRRSPLISAIASAGGAPAEICPRRLISTRADHLPSEDAFSCAKAHGSRDSRRSLGGRRRKRQWCRPHVYPCNRAALPGLHREDVSATEARSASTPVVARYALRPNGRSHR